MQGTGAPTFLSASPERSTIKGRQECRRPGNRELRPVQSVPRFYRLTALLLHGFAALLGDMSAESRVKELNLELPPAPKPMGVYKPLVICGNMVYVSGHGPLKPDKSLMTGRVGADLDVAAGKAAARQTGLAILATLQSGLGSLDKVKRVIKVLGMVNCTAEFGEHPAVINGCSELFAEVFGPENGIGARSAVGMGSLPGQIAVEIEAIFEL
jgi:enamine deaminase RidA (YjgF/YER057c/UK114 family)